MEYKYWEWYYDPGDAGLSAIFTMITPAKFKGTSYNIGFEIVSDEDFDDIGMFKFGAVNDLQHLEDKEFLSVNREDMKEIQKILLNKSHFIISKVFNTFQ